MSWFDIVHNILAVLDQVFPFYIYWYLHKLATQSREEIVDLRARVLGNDRRVEDILYRLSRDAGGLRADLEKLKRGDRARQRSNRKHRKETLQ